MGFETRGKIVIQPKACIGAYWRRKVDKKKRVANRTSGWTKGETCKASPFQRFCCVRSRAYKHINYNSWLEATRNPERRFG